MTSWIRLCGLWAVLQLGGCYPSATTQTAELPVSRDTPLYIDVPEHRNLRLNGPPGAEVALAKLDNDPAAGDKDGAKDTGNADGVQQASAKQTSSYTPATVPVL